MVFHSDEEFLAIQNAIYVPYHYEVIRPEILRDIHKEMGPENYRIVSVVDFEPAGCPRWGGWCRESYAIEWGIPVLDFCDIAICESPPDDVFPDNLSTLFEQEYAQW